MYRLIAAPSRSRHGVWSAITGAVGKDPSVTPAARQHRTVFWLQSTSTAIAGTRSPDQLNSIIRARITASRGPFRARDKRRTTVRSSSSRPGRARKTIVQHPPPSAINYPATRT